MQFDRFPPKWTEIPYIGVLFQRKLDYVLTYAIFRFFDNVAQIEPLICLKS